MIPKTLAEVAELAAQGEPFDLCLRNFLDDFYAHPSFVALQAEPLTLESCDSKNGAVKDAYLAATAEWLSWRYDLPARNGHSQRLGHYIARGLLPHSPHSARCCSGKVPRLFVRGIFSSVKMR